MSDRYIRRSQVSLRSSIGERCEWRGPHAWTLDARLEPKRSNGICFLGARGNTSFLSFPPKKRWFIRSKSQTTSKEHQCMETMHGIIEHGKCEIIHSSISLFDMHDNLSFSHILLFKVIQKVKKGNITFFIHRAIPSPKTMKTWWLWHMRCHKKELFYQTISSQANENDKKMPIFDFWGTFFLPPSFLSDFSIITCPSRPRMSFLGRNKDCCKKSFFSRSTQMIDSKMFCSQRTSLLPPTVSTYRSCDNKLKRYPGKISRVWKWMAYHRLVWTFADCGHNKGKLTKATLMRLLTRQELKKVPSR